MKLLKKIKIKKKKKKFPQSFFRITLFYKNIFTIKLLSLDPILKIKSWDFKIELSFKKNPMNLFHETPFSFVFPKLVYLQKRFFFFFK